MKYFELDIPSNQWFVLTFFDRYYSNIFNDDLEKYKNEKTYCSGLHIRFDNDNIPRLVFDRYYCMENTKIIDFCETRSTSKVEKIAINDKTIEVECTGAKYIFEQVDDHPYHVEFFREIEMENE